MNILTLPDLTNNPDTRVAYTINGKEYMFRFRWCDTFCLLDIYVINDNENVYLVKGHAITTDSDLIGRVKNSSLITGSLVYTNKYQQNIEPDQDNFNTDFYLIYIPEDEL